MSDPDHLDRRTGDANTERIHSRLDLALELLQELKTNHAIFVNNQKRCEEDMRELTLKLRSKVDTDDAIKAQVKLEHDIEALERNFDLGRRYITQYLGERKFVLGIIFALGAGFTAVNGLFVKVATTYYDEITNKIRDTQFAETRNATDINTLRDKMMQLHAPVPGGKVP